MQLFHVSHDVAYGDLANVQHVVHIAAASIFVDKIMVHDLRRMASRYRITVVCAPGDEVDRLRRERFTVHTIPIRRKLAPHRDIITLWSLTKFLRASHPDIVHTYGPKAGLLGQIAAKMAQVPVTVHACRGLLYTDDMPRWRKVLYRTTDRLTNTLAQAILYVSHADLDFSVKTKLVSENKVRHTGTGVDVAHFITSANGQPVNTLDYGIKTGSKIVLTVARYVEAKGFRELAAAAAELARNRKDVTFLWIAPVLPDEEGALSDTLLENVSGANIIRINGVDDVRGFYRIAHVLVHPSHREGVPRVLMEAALAKVPIVASDIPGCREVITDGEDGWLFKVGDAHELVRAIGAALDDTQEADRRARLARERVIRDFDQDSLTERIMAVYGELLNNPRVETHIRSHRGDRG